MSTTGRPYASQSSILSASHVNRHASRFSPAKPTRVPFTWAATYLGRDGESLDLLLSVYEFDLAVDSEVTHGGIPDVPGVGHHLVHERLGAEAGPLLDAPPRHRQPRRREANPGSGAPLARSRPHCSRGAVSAARHLRWQVRW